MRARSGALTRSENDCRATLPVGYCKSERRGASALRSWRLNYGRARLPSGFSVVNGLGVPGFVTPGRSPGEGGSPAFGSDVAATSSGTQLFGVSPFLHAPGGFGVADSEPSGQRKEHEPSSAPSGVMTEAFNRKMLMPPTPCTAPPPYSQCQRLPFSSTGKSHQ